MRFPPWLSIGAVVLLALLVREYFVLAGVVAVPIRGDIREYVLYAWNLAHHGVFSMALPDAPVAVPDGYRAPGYPALLALCMRLRPQGNGWYDLALQAQVLLGTATVWLTLLVARRWLPLGWALLAGVLIALWPHHVVATGALLSEVAFGFTLMAALYAFGRAMQAHRRTPWLVLAALAFGAAYLVNPLIALFPPLLAWWVARRHGDVRRPLLFLAVFMVPVMAWGLRNASLAQAPEARTGRVAMNFVQGAWPDYHAAWRSGSQPTLDAIGEEIALLDRDPARGLQRIATRMQDDPLRYVGWYLWRKPLLLWDWNIRLGAGGAYVLDVANSPLQSNALLRASSTLLEAVNPLLTLLAFTAMPWLLVAGLRRDPRVPDVAVAAAMLAVYVTVLHALLQAEPRHANAYRGIEALMVASCLHMLLRGGSGRWRARVGRPGSDADGQVLPPT